MTSRILGFFACMVILCGLAIFGCSQAETAPTGKQPSAKSGSESMTIDKVTLAINDMDAAVKFYSAVLESEFKSIQLQERTLYETHANGVEFLLCPRELAQVDANIDNNTIQIRLVVDDVRKVHKAGLEHGGKEITGVLEMEGQVQSSLRDPDGNSIELIQFMR